MRLSTPAGSGRIVAWAAWGSLAVSVVVLVAGLWVGLDTVFVSPYVPVSVFAVATMLIGVVVVTRIPDSRSGWLLIVLAVAATVAITFRQFAFAFVADGGSGLVPAQLFIAVADASFHLMLTVAALLFLTFPTGRLLSARWRPVVWMLVAITAVGVLVESVGAGDITDPEAYLITTGYTTAEGVDNVEIYTAIFTVVFALLIVVFVASVVSLVLRLRRARGEERQQLKWVAYTSVVAVVLFPVDAVRSSSELVWALQQFVASAGMVLLPVGFGVALFKYRLWDIDVVIRRSVVYGVLWLAIAGAYVGVAAGFGLVAETRFPVGVAIAMTVLATIAFQPARRWLERSADRWVFGRRSSPLQAVHGFGELVGDADRPGDIATQLAQTAAAATGLAWVEVALDDSAPALFGTATEVPPVTIPIMRGDRRFGSMVCKTFPGRRLSSRDQELLTALASQAALAVSHARLSSRIVQAQEAERRRIERNIHDGAQQELAALVGQLGLARAHVNGDSSTARALSEAQRDARQILANLRDLAQGIHPSVLRDGGLAAAVEDRCSRMPIGVKLDLAPAVHARRFRDDIEGAAYFFVSEALTNVLKHSQATEVKVTLAVDNDKLTLEVTDSGVGFDPRERWGNGLTGLTDRIHVLDGEITIGNGPSNGARLTATLPIAATPSGSS